MPLALLAALTWGGGDFSGGMSVKRAGGSAAAALRVVLLSHSLSLVALAVVLALRHDPLPQGTPVLWGLAAGVLGGAGCLIFYTVLASGAMGASAAVSGMLAAAIPALVSMALEGAPAAVQLCGFVLAAAAIWFIASSPGATPAPRRTLLLAILAGAGFGFYFVSLRMAGAAGVVVPLALSRVASIAVCLVGILVLRVRASSSLGQEAPRVHLNRQAVTWAVATAVLDTAGNLFYIAATRAGRLDIAAVLASLYPASTILLAAWLLRERPSVRQGVGMALALAAVVLITL